MRELTSSVSPSYCSFTHFDCRSNPELRFIPLRRVSNAIYMMALMDFPRPALAAQDAAKQAMLCKDVMAVNDTMSKRVLAGEDDYADLRDLNFAVCLYLLKTLPKDVAVAFGSDEASCEPRQLASFFGLEAVWDYVSMFCA